MQDNNLQEFKAKVSQVWDDDDKLEELWWVIRKEYEKSGDREFLKMINDISNRLDVLEQSSRIVLKRENIIMGIYGVDYVATECDVFTNGRKISWNIEVSIAEDKKSIKQETDLYFLEIIILTASKDQAYTVFDRLVKGSEEIGKRDKEISEKARTTGFIIGENNDDLDLTWDTMTMNDGVSSDIINLVERDMENFIGKIEQNNRVVLKEERTMDVVLRGMICQLCGRGKLVEYGTSALKQYQIEIVIPCDYASADFGDLVKESEKIKSQLSL